MKKAVVAVCVLLCATLAAAPAAAKPPPAVAIYTMGPGAQLFERFGHAAICLHYPNAGRDRCYNYGTADFDSPVPLTWGFLRGRALFWVSQIHPGAMLEQYRAADRTVWRQDLPLSAEQARRVAARLATDSRPENRSYHYHHFYNNCATKLRDILDEATGGQLRRGSAEPPGPTFRQLARQGFAEQDGILLLTDLLVGRAADRAVSRWEGMFLPRYLRAAVAERWGAAPVVLYQRKGPAFSADPGPVRAFWLLFAALLALPPVLARRRRLSERAQRWLLLPTALVLGLAGLTIWALAALGTLPELQLNEAGLVLLPFDGALPLLKAPSRRRYARTRLVMLVTVSAMLALGLFKQPLWLPILAVFAPLAALAFRWPAPRAARASASR